MYLLPYIFLGFIIYLMLIAPLFIVVLAINFVSKKIEFDDVTCWNTIKLTTLNLIVGFFLFVIFVIFAGKPFTKFVQVINNPYLNLLVLLTIISIAIFFVVVHFKIFTLYIKGFYETSKVKNILIYVSVSSAVWFLISFYSSITEVIHKMVYFV